jgi:hypothetical protein
MRNLMSKPELHYNIAQPVLHYNIAHKGVELKFSEKPNEEILQLLSSNRFRWHPTRKIWFAKHNEASELIARQVIAKFNEPKFNEPKFNEPKFNDGDQEFRKSEVEAFLGLKGHPTFLGNLRDRSLNIPYTLRKMPTKIGARLMGIYRKSDVLEFREKWNIHIKSLNREGSIFFNEDFSPCGIIRHSDAAPRKEPVLPASMLPSTPDPFIPKALEPIIRLLQEKDEEITHLRGELQKSQHKCLLVEQDAQKYQESNKLFNDLVAENALLKQLHVQLTIKLDAIRDSLK